MRSAVRLNLGGGGLAALVLLTTLAMSFSYGPSASPPTLNPQIDYVRLLCADTQQFDAKGNQIFIFSDQEILAAAQICTTVFQSSQFYSGPGGQFVPPQPPDYYRTAGTLLRALAANKARLASIKKLLDVQLDSADASIQLRETADDYFEMSDNSGAFAIIEQVQDYWSFSDRFWKQVQRQQGV